MGKYIISAFLLMMTLQVTAQQTTVPAEVKLFVLKGYEVLDYVSGDLNGDKKNDAILLLKVTGEDTVTDEVKRPMLLLIRQANGKLKLEKRNDDAILCKACGGAMGDPYQETAIKNNGFSFSFYGGSSWRWGDNYWFTYKPTLHDWYLVKEEHESFQAGDPDATSKKSVIEEAELGGTSFEKFNSIPDYKEVKWKVIAAKTFFYDDPKLGGNHRKGYLLKNNIVSQLRVLKNFVEVSFENTKGQFTNGFILKTDLEQIK